FRANAENAIPIPSVPILGLSPDERSFVRFAYADGSESKPVLVVVDTVASTVETLPIDRTRMRYLNFKWLDRRWLDHHFTWVRGADGADRLVARKDFKPLPFHGDLSPANGGWREYRLDLGSEPLRAALLDFVVKEMGAERQ